MNQSDHGDTLQKSYYLHTAITFPGPPKVMQYIMLINFVYTLKNCLNYSNIQRFCPDSYYFWPKKLISSQMFRIFKTINNSSKLDDTYIVLQLIKSQKYGFHKTPSLGHWLLLSMIKPLVNASRHM